ncbi:hypothetical protein AAULR_01660 [Lacticaseibacillus rhamnosus MTCC 5462]|nr:hypothetical protein LRH_12344 [Lacticaseibacillus rhamnosus HN001]EGF34363.1 hypothetical protein AAULR_01660 [Lacticaseibacillus rhamnosus MTCC 5462]
MSTTKLPVNEAKMPTKPRRKFSGRGLIGIF